MNLRKNLDTTCRKRQKDKLKTAQTKANKE